ncbi:class Ib ribonucleoside-diphosphate reductase assembly flavoprotein NrdI [Sphingobacteriaceae bacterium WQ 2009]|uniref:Class Ib ribonucleoside-diphosphate reductase assembly flavoprotein NrdI n=1 Tax=Rhinopithecimicrobium faecis TaxID=2820698 RepID=A0A8T4HAC8_9SPHI|nr:class Ib ribonucleoside-diphosphate reductase assembly flavoprotein NrdI [Sphingobacteriaceae bacterium WQ 2009]
MVHIYFDSKTGNVQRFMDKVTQITGWKAYKIGPTTTAKVPGHLVTFTTRFGDVPDTTREFMNREAKQIFTVSSSGNTNWGRNFALAAEKIATDYSVPIALKFELSGTMNDINQFIEIIKKNNYYYECKHGSIKLDIA